MGAIKENNGVIFEEEGHKYYRKDNPEQTFVSVTTLIHQFTQEFDRSFWSAYKALEKLLSKESWAIEKKSLLNTKKFDKSILDLYEITENDFNKEQQSILDAWDEENRRSCERGTKIHSELEHSFYKKGKNIDISKFQIDGTFECIKDKTELDLENGVYPEYLISFDSKDNRFHLAGQIDLLVKKGNSIIVGDFKTNKKIDQKSFFDSKSRTSQKMKFPLNSLEDCNYWHYTLQLSTYAWMLQVLNPEFVIEDLVLIHFDHDDNMTVYHLPYLKDEVVKMLSFYKKEMLLAENKKKRQRIEY